MTTDTVETKDATVMKDDMMEWRLLNKLLLTENRDYINRLMPDMFTGIRAEVFRAMQLDFTDNGTITYEGIHLKMKGKVPGQLTAANSGDVQTLIKQLTRLAVKRQLVERSALLAKLGHEYNPSMFDVQNVLDFAPILADEDSTLATGAQSMLGNLHAKRSGEYIFAKTGFKFFDRHMGGEYKPKAFMIWAGGVGSGKTTLWINSQLKMAQGYTAKNNHIRTPSLFLSLEMSKEDLLVKMAAHELEIDTTEILTGEFTNALADHPEWKSENDIIRALENKVAELTQLPMYIIDNGSLTLAQMVYEIRKHVHKYGVRVVCIDYLQIANHAPTGNKNNDLGSFALALKQLAKRENITIIVLSQINRAGEQVDVIRDSGEVQAVADVIIQLIPEDENMLAGATTTKSISIGWWKNRFGPAGRKTAIMLHGPYQKFIEG